MLSDRVRTAREWKQTGGPMADSAAHVSPIGLVGRITVATRGADGPGEAEFRIRGGTEVFIAQSKDPLPKGSAVLCIDTPAPRTVLVTAWTDSVGHLD
jgi:hypothetical protein